METLRISRIKCKRQIKCQTQKTQSKKKLHTNVTAKQKSKTNNANSYNTDNHRKKYNISEDITPLKLTLE